MTQLDTEFLKRYFLEHSYEGVKTAHRVARPSAEVQGPQTYVLFLSHILPIAEV